MTEPIPADHVIGDSGHTNDHNNIITTLSTLATMSGQLQASITALQAATSGLFYAAGGNVCNIPDLITALATVNLPAINRDTGVDILDILYGTQKAFSINSYGDTVLFPSEISHTPFTIQSLAGQTANLWQVLNSTGTPIAYITSTGNLITTGNVRAGGQVNATNPAAGGAEVWHTMTLPGTWGTGTNNGTSDPASYSLTPEGWLALRGTLITPSSGGINGTFATLPAAYRPTGRVASAAITNSTGNQPGQVQITPAGAVSLNGTNWNNAYTIILDSILLIS